MRYSFYTSDASGSATTGSSYGHGFYQRQIDPITNRGKMLAQKIDLSLQESIELLNLFIYKRTGEQLKGNIDINPISKFEQAITVATSYFILI